MRIPFPIPFVLSGLLLIPSLILGTDWACFGGNVGRTYTSPDLIKPPLKLLWRNKDPEGSTMLGEVVVGGGKVFTRNNDGPTLCAFDLNTGDLIWKKYDPVDGLYGTSGSLGGTSMMYYAGRIYYQDLVNPLRPSRLICRDANTGDTLWSRVIGGVTSGELYYMTSPVAWDSVVYCETAAPAFRPDTVYYYAFNAFTGNPIWARKYPGYDLALSLSVDTVNRRLYGGACPAAVGGDAFVFAAPLSTGDTTVWTHHFTWPGTQYGLALTSYCNDTLVVSGFSSGFSRIIDAQTGTAFKVFSGTTCPLFINDQLIMSGSFYDYTRLWDRKGNVIGNSGSIHSHTAGRCGRPAMANGYIWRAGQTPRVQDKYTGAISAFCLNTMKGGACVQPPLWVGYNSDAMSCVTPVICGNKVLLFCRAFVACYQQE